MHEMSIAMEVCAIAERAIGECSPSCVREIVVEVGDECGLEPANLEFCLTALLQTAPFGLARPSLRRLPGDVLRVAHIEVEECL